MISGGLRMFEGQGHQENWTGTLSGFIYHIIIIQEGTSAADLFILQHYGLIKKINKSHDHFYEEILLYFILATFLC